MGIILLVASGLRLLDLFNTPDGILYDEAYNAVDAATAFSNPTPFFHSNYGREAGFIYIQALALRLFGYNTFAMRFPAAALGLLTVSAAYPLFSRLFGRRVGVFSAAWLAVSLWHVIFSRTGLRAIALPLALAVAFYCFSRAAMPVGTDRSPESNQRDARKTVFWFVLTGVVLGLAQYTYTAARFAPLVILGVVGIQLLAQRQRARLLATGAIWAGLAGAVVTAPLGLYFLAHPADFFERAGQISVFTQGQSNDVGGTLAYSVSATLGLFGLRGDPSWDRNVSQLPALDPVSYVLFLLGVALALWRWRTFAVQLTLSWLIVMLVPHALTSAYIPNYLRSVGALPAILTFPAVGLDLLIRRLSVARRVAWPAMATIVAAGMAAGAASTAFLYFFVWAGQPMVLDMFHSAQVREFTEAYQLVMNNPGARVYVSVPGANGGMDPVTFFLARATRPAGAPDPTGAGRLRPYVAGDSLVIPPKGARAIYLVTPETKVPASLEARHLSGAASVRKPSGTTTLSIETPQLVVEQPMQARFGDLVDFVGYAMPKRVRAGDTLEVVLYWKVHRPVGRIGVSMFAHLVDASHVAQSKVDSDVSLLHEREPDEVVAQVFRVAVPERLQTGAYWVSAGMYEQRSVSRLRVVDPQGRDGGDSVLLGPIKVDSLDGQGEAEVETARYWFGGQIGLQGYEISRRVVAPGQSLAVDLHWVVQQRPIADYTMFLQLLDNRQKVIAQTDAQPRQGGYPTSLWDAGEAVDDNLELRIPGDAAQGRMTLIVGFYDKAGSRLAVQDSLGSPQGDFATLGEVDVVR